MEINKIGKIAKVLENNLSNLKLNLFKPEEKSLESNVSLKDIKNKFFNTEKESLDLNDNSPLSTFLNLKI
jgi:hypothetical protein